MFFGKLYESNDIVSSPFFLIGDVAGERVGVKPIESLMKMKKTLSQLLPMMKLRVCQHRLICVVFYTFADQSVELVLLPYFDHYAQSSDELSLKKRKKVHRTANNNMVSRLFHFVDLELSDEIEYALARRLVD